MIEIMKSLKWSLAIFLVLLAASACTGGEQRGGGHHHIGDAVGPDEYHRGVNDGADTKSHDAPQTEAGGMGVAT